MELTKQQTDSVIARIREFGLTQCALCKNQNWIVSDTLFVMPEYSKPDPFAWSAPLTGPGTYVPNPLGSSVPTSLKVFPVVPITCRDCGYVMLIAAKFLGLL
jgi:hypothetical protein